MRLQRILLILLAFLVISGLGSYVYFTSNLPSIQVLEDYRPDLVTRVYSARGREVAEFYTERRVLVPIEKVPKHLIEAFLAAEDAEFYHHEGISISGILRAFYTNVKAGKIVQGGSTITQQLVKSLLFSSEKKISRKIKEAIMAYRLEKHLTKNEILTMYLNQIYLGSSAYGIQSATEAYFGHDVEETDLAEAALLAGLPKAPNRYSPYANFDLAKRRQAFVLDRMVEERFITRQQAEDAKAEELVLKSADMKDLWVGPYFTEHVRRYIEEKYGYDVLYKGGLSVYTTMDVDMQRSANLAVSEGLKEYDRRRGYRGPVTKLKTPEAVEEFKKGVDEENAREPIEDGKTYRAVVTRVDEKSGTLGVEIGSRPGVISRRDLRWARLYNPTGEPDGGVREGLSEVFHEGDVIEVMVKKVTEDPKRPVYLQLDQKPLAEASLLAMEPSTGFVRAMVGGSDYADTQFNRAVQARRQPGSSFKAIIYSAALDRKYTPATIIIDSPLVFEEADADQEKTIEPQDDVTDGQEEQDPEKTKWRPRNYDERFYGPITVREAVAKSRNVVTIKVLNDIGVDTAIRYAHKMGIESPLARDLSLALGSSAVTLQEMTTAFATIDNLGKKPEPVYITKIVDHNGNVLEENKPVLTEALSPQTAYLMTSLLQSVVEEGTGWRARALKRPVAGKTGTTNGLNDAWFLGFTPDVVAGAWVGYDSEKKLGRYETGSRAALPIWLKFMQDVTRGTEIKNFQMPEGLEFAKIDPMTGLLATPLTKDPVFEVFRAGTAPTRSELASGKKASTDFFLMDSGGGYDPSRDEIPLFKEEDSEEAEAPPAPTGAVVEAPSAPPAVPEGAPNPEKPIRKLAEQPGKPASATPDAVKKKKKPSLLERIFGTRSK